MSQKTSVTTEINGHNYEMFMLAPMVSLKHLSNLIQMIGPSVGPVIEIFFQGATAKQQKDLLETELKPGFFAQAVKTFCEKLDSKVVFDIIKAFREVSFSDGKPLDAVFDIHFQGKIDELIKWLLWGMKAQWGNCWSAAADAVVNRSAMIPQASQSQSTLNG